METWAVAAPARRSGAKEARSCEVRQQGGGLPKPAAGGCELARTQALAGLERRGQDGGGAAAAARSAGPRSRGRLVPLERLEAAPATGKEN